MTRASAHRINAAVCALVFAHAIYWFATGHAAGASAFRVSLVVAQAVLGVVGIAWFWRRSLGAL
jgi:4-amino-4-deoxy-L-arabinose transferase-like glycosyltransferase